MAQQNSIAQEVTPGAIAKVHTGIRGVDSVLEGGLPSGRTTLIGGGPGTGKTVLGLEFLYRGAEAGEPGIFVTFEERAEAVRQNARAMGWDLDSLEQAGSLFVMQAETPTDLVLSGEFTIDGLLAILSGQADRLGARRIVVDAVDMLMRLFQDPLRERNQLLALHNWLRDRQLTAILTLKHFGQNTDHGDHLEYMADCVIRLDQRVEDQVATRRLRVLKYRGSGFLSNEYPYVITPNGVVLMPISTAALAHQASGPAISTGISALDEVSGGGFLRGSCILIAGSSGTGKTTLASMFAAAACRRGEKVLYVSFEDSREAIVAAMLSPGIQLAPLVDSGQLRMLTAMPEAMGVESHLLQVFRAMEAFGPAHVIVDAISACRRMGSEQPAFDFVVRLLTRCKELGITCMFTNQTREPQAGEELSGLGISSLVDTVVRLEQIWSGQSYQRRMLIFKSRGTKHSHAHHPFAITDEGIRLVVPALGNPAPPGGGASPERKGTDP